MRTQAYTRTAYWRCLLAAVLAVASVAKADTVRGVTPVGVERLVAGPLSSPRPGCFVSARCPSFSGGHRPSAAEYEGLAARSYKSSLEIGAYGPVQFKFYGNRVKMNWRF